MSDLTAIDKLQKRLQNLQTKEQQNKAQQKQLRARLATAERKARTKRLIEKGAELEKLQGPTAEQILPTDTAKWLAEHYQTPDQQRYQALIAYTKQVTYANGTSVFDGFTAEYDTQDSQNQPKNTP